jgi:hypothetical protein
MLNERNRRASDVWAPQAGVVFQSGMGAVLQPYPKIQDVDPNLGAKGDVRILEYDGVCSDSPPPSIKFCKVTSDKTPCNAVESCVSGFCIAGQPSSTICMKDSDCDNGSGADGKCTPLEVDRLCGEEVCQAITCTDDATCDERCLLPAGQLEGRCTCSGTGSCGSGGGQCVGPEVVWDLTDDCLPHELRDTWKCAECQWYLDPGGPNADCSYLGIPNCGTRIPEISEQAGVLAVHARALLTDYGDFAYHAGRAIIGSPLYPWLIVPDPRVTCRGGDTKPTCDLSCPGCERTLAHELGHVLSLEHRDPSSTLPPLLMVKGGDGLHMEESEADKARKYVDPLDPSLADLCLPKPLTGDDPASVAAAAQQAGDGTEGSRMGSSYDAIGDAPGGEAFLDVEKIQVVAKSRQDGSLRGREELVFRIGIAGILPTRKGPMVLEWGVDTDGKESTPRVQPSSPDEPGQPAWPMPGAERIIRVRVTPSGSISEDGETQFDAEASIIALDEPGVPPSEVDYPGKIIESARILYLSRPGRRAGGRGADKVPVRSEISVVLMEPHQALGIRRGVPLFPDGIRLQVAARKERATLRDVGPDQPIFLTLQRSQAPRLVFPARAVRGETYPMAVLGFPPFARLRVSVGGVILPTMGMTGKDGRANLSLRLPPEVRLGAQSLSVKVDSPRVATGATTLVRVVDRR